MMHVGIWLRLAVVMCPLFLLVCAIGFGAVDAAPTQPAQKSGGMFRTGPAKEMPIYDPRFSRGTITYMLIEEKVVLDGDLVLGTEKEILQRSLRLAVKTAKEATKMLPGQKEAAIERLKDVQLKNKLSVLADKNPDRVPDDDLRKEVGVANEALKPLQDWRKSDDGGLQQHAFVVFGEAKGEFLWPDGVIPYEIDTGVPDEVVIRDAMKHWSDKTSVITFVKKGEKHKDYVQFVGGGGCYSEAVGRRGGEQKVGMSKGCRVQQVIHEIGHVVGMFHEHNRHDRDLYIEIDEKQIEGGASVQFKQSAILAEDKGVDSGDFDWKSIMLYPPNAFTKHEQQTLIRKKPSDDTKWGIASGEPHGGITTELSAGDVAAIRKLYTPKK